MVRCVLVLVLGVACARSVAAQGEPNELGALIAAWSSADFATRERASAAVEARWWAWSDADLVVLASTAAQHADLEVRGRATGALGAIDARYRAWLLREAAGDLARDPAAVRPRLRRLARHTDAAMQVPAIALLSRAPDPADEALLAELVASSHDAVSLAALAGLGLRKAARWVPEIEPALRRPGTRVAALDTLVAIGGPAAAAAIARQVDAPDPGQSVQAMRALGRVGAADHVDLVLAFVTDGREPALAAAGMEVLRVTPGEAVLRGLRVLVDHRAPAQRLFALDMLGQRRDRASVEAFVRRLVDAELEVRLMAVRALVRVGALDRLVRADAREIIAALANPGRNGAEVAELVDGLVATGADDTVPALVGVLVRNDPVAVEPALGALVRLGARAEARQILGLLQRDVPALHLPALRALAALESDVHRGLLTGILVRSDPGLGDLAAAELLRLVAVDQVDAVVELLGHDDRAVRCRALRVVAGLAPGAHIRAIAEQLAVDPIAERPDPAAVAEALLLALDPAAHAHEVSRLLADPRPRTRERAIRVLGRWPAPAHAAEVGRALDDRDPDVRLAALEVLGLLGDRAHLDRIVAALADETLTRTAAHALVRLRAVEQLAAIRAQLVYSDDRIRGYALKAYRKLASPADLVALLRLESATLRDLTQGFLKTTGVEAMAPLVALARWHEETPAARRAAMEAMVAIDSDRAVVELLPLVVGSDPGFAAMVGDILAATGAGAVFPEEYLSYLEHASPVVVRETIKVAARHGGAAYADRLARLLETHPDRLVRQQALVALGEVGGAAQLPSVRAALRDSSHTIRGMAARQLGRHAGPEVARDLANLLGEVDFDTRQHAVRALGALASRHAELREATWLREKLESLAIPLAVEGHLHYEQRYGVLAVLIRLGALSEARQLEVLEQAVRDRAEWKLHGAIGDVVRALEAVHERAALAKLDVMVQVRRPTREVLASMEDMHAALRDCAAQAGLELVAGNASVFRLPVGMKRSLADVLAFGLDGNNRVSGLGYALRGGAIHLLNANDEAAYIEAWIARLRR